MKEKIPVSETLRLFIDETVPSYTGFKGWGETKGILIVHLHTVCSGLDSLLDALGVYSAHALIVILGS